MSGVLAVGDVIDDVVVRPSGPIAPDTDTPSTISRVAGGSAANTACWLAATGTPATLVASVGAADVAWHAALLAASGVRAELRASARSTGTIVVLSEGDARAMLTDRGANADTTPDLVPDALLAEHDALHLTGHLFAGADRDDAWRDLLDRARRTGALTCVAPGSAGLLRDVGADRVRRIVEGVDVLLAGLDEARLLTGEADAEAAARALAARHPLAVVTSGAAGSVLVRRGAVVHVPSVRAGTVDVTGAGDAYAAGLLGALLAGADDAAAGARAAGLAARAVARVGARP